MKKFFFILVCILILNINCFSQNKLAEFKRNFKKNYNFNFLNQKQFDKSRELVLKTLDKNLLNNDTIVLIEKYTDVMPVYFCSVYFSEGNIFTHYKVDNKIIGEKYTSELELHKYTYTKFSDYILKEIRKNKINLIIKKGGVSRITPETRLIISIISKENKKYRYQTFVTSMFDVDNKTDYYK